jgi:hypothetical protein
MCATVSDHVHTLGACNTNLQGTDVIGHVLHQRANLRGKPFDAGEALT